MYPVSQLNFKMTINNFGIDFVTMNLISRFRDEICWKVLQDTPVISTFNLTCNLYP